MGASLRLGRIFGIPVEVNISWTVVFLLLTFVLAQQFGRADPDWPVAQRWLVAMVLVVLFFMSVLAHEISHSLLARHEGIPVRGITLFIFGGVSRLDREPDRPFTDFAIAVVGPLTSLVLAAVFGGLWYVLRDGNSTLEVVVLLLAWSNLSLGVFNILPGYPLDGGRVLRSLVWRITGSYRTATKVATRSGQAIGGIMVVMGMGLSLFANAVDGVWLALIGAFLFFVATAGYRQDHSRSNAPGMDRDPPGHEL